MPWVASEGCLSAFFFFFSLSPSEAKPRPCLELGVWEGDLASNLRVFFLFLVLLFLLFCLFDVKMEWNEEAVFFIGHQC